ncbi:hypothetical protein BHYA_0004g00180 [Botrytis hyacinthi]|uniref:Uncharacterized protein n=1 Tax=Botrytis hyacinthi TaxID=278943 RepID=A0A4Z1H615_9HELO|nr:hypothetical protein BHYA_0004g00180 [Botrytis hyacinthi]
MGELRTEKTIEGKGVEISSTIEKLDSSGITRLPSYNRKLEDHPIRKEQFFNNDEFLWSDTSYSMNPGNTGTLNVTYIHSNDVHNIQTRHYINPNVGIEGKDSYGGVQQKSLIQELKSGWFSGQYWEFLISVGTQ